MPDKNLVTVEVEVGAELFHQVEVILKPYGLTPEDAIVMFCEYLTNPKTKKEAITLLLKWCDEFGVPHNAPPEEWL